MLFIYTDILAQSTAYRTTAASAWREIQLARTLLNKPVHSTVGELMKLQSSGINDVYPSKEPA
ncbi:MAG: hypothetical protein CVU24_08970 [Betaproteobacteria bacterium HGW-Betaproteobacteria-18]|nr:MAG: hypothetical protein CVU24_08970 [Betaproteobacteria bacterium HGW-Betaproteobacteria-18]